MKNKKNAILGGFFTLLLLSVTTIFAVVPLPIEQAFTFTASVVNHSDIKVILQPAPHYYLYRDKLHFNIQPASVKLGQFNLPQGTVKHDDILGDYRVLAEETTLDLPLITGGKKVTLLIHYQGCSSEGFCYPPSSKSFDLDLFSNDTSANTGNSIATVHALSSSTQDDIAKLLAQQNVAVILLSFFGFGLLLALTPCVLPMIPILSGIILGSGKHITLRKSFFLSFFYVLSMSLTYAAAGIFAGFAGESVQAWLQNPWVLGTFSVVFVFLALSLFGFYELALPHRWQQRLNKLSRSQEGGSYLGAVIMGALATLIVSPCVTPPLIGALGYIGQTGNALLGGISLFAMGFGMGMPLLFIGFSGGKLLPKAGQWMNTIKHIFGVVMLAMAINLLSRLLPGEITLVLWAILFITCAVYMGALDLHPATQWHRLWKGLGLIMIFYGIILLVGAAMGNTDPLKPLQRIGSFQSVEDKGEKLLFTRVKNLTALQVALKAAKQNHQAVMIDFYADWCVACQELERNTFSDAHLQKILQPVMRLQIDVTANSTDDAILEKHFGVIAPPTILFLHADGLVIPGASIVGVVSAHELEQHLQKFGVI